MTHINNSQKNNQNKALEALRRQLFLEAGTREYCRTRGIPLDRETESLLIHMQWCEKAAYKTDWMLINGYHFYKFYDSSNNNPQCQEGDSLVEIIGKSRSTIYRRFKKIGVIYKSVTAFNEAKRRAQETGYDIFQDKLWIQVYNRRTHVPYYIKNVKLYAHCAQQAELRRQRKQYTAMQKEAVVQIAQQEKKQAKTLAKEKENQILVMQQTIADLRAQVSILKNNQEKTVLTAAENSKKVNLILQGEKAKSEFDEYCDLYNIYNNYNNYYKSKEIQKNSSSYNQKEPKSELAVTSSPKTELEPTKKPSGAKKTPDYGKKRHLHNLKRKEKEKEAQISTETLQKLYHLIEEITGQRIPLTPTLGKNIAYTFICLCKRDLMFWAYLLMSLTSSSLLAGLSRKYPHFKPNICFYLSPSFSKMAKRILFNDRTPPYIGKMVKEYREQLDALYGKYKVNYLMDSLYDNKEGTKKQLIAFLAKHQSEIKGYEWYINKIKHQGYICNGFEYLEWYKLFMVQHFYAETRNQVVYLLRLGNHLSLLRHTVSTIPRVLWKNKKSRIIEDHSARSNNTNNNSYG